MVQYCVKCDISHNFDKVPLDYNKPTTATFEGAIKLNQQLSYK